ncbi:TrmO family methyltransferase domain-containing protein [Vibrio hepatarius]|uniref:TrmO family methyltransferase domain-containing protein n=1 Tax=Vibrio hepatarius TaxID=171383 RepID=UPI001C09F03C|nr:TrmO family methyltransferase [Vibrio hepatarius]MBU2896162.1 SAM-dependent methyltransferase [Vibrio hepatarius]
MISIKPIAIVKNNIDSPQDDNWGSVISNIVLENEIPLETLIGLNSFSHVTIVFYMHKVIDEKICLGARHPRNNSNIDPVGILSQRGKNRINKIGVTDCSIVDVSGNTLRVKGLDAINGSLVVDIKPVFKQFLVDKEKVIQPIWVDKVMSDYFNV